MPLSELKKDEIRLCKGLSRLLHKRSRVPRKEALRIAYSAIMDHSDKYNLHPDYAPGVMNLYLEDHFDSSY